jgi:hypothetical protein
MTVSPLPLRGGVQGDRRDQGRAVRVSAHPESGTVLLSMWRDDHCVATHQMAPDDVPELIGLLARALACCTATTRGPSAEFSHGRSDDNR